ncbi:MAG: hypothetical protein ABIF09_05545 [Gemmatimonadota bacterium]
MIDPEALLAFSLCLSDEERRLEDMVAWWARVGSHLTSLQRFRSLSRRFPGQEGTRTLGTYARMAVAAGDKRWARYVVRLERDEGEGRGARRGRDEPNLMEPCTLWLRLRAGLGVGAKADILAFLLGSNGQWASAKTIAFATHYSGVTIRKAAGEMALARLIRDTDDRPTEYRAPSAPWWELLQPKPRSEGPGAAAEAPGWRYWSEIFAFLVGVMEWSRAAADTAGGSPYVVASEARDLMEKHRKAFTLAGVQTPPAEAFPGREAPEDLAETVEVVLGWMREAL